MGGRKGGREGGKGEGGEEGEGRGGSRAVAQRLREEVDWLGRRRNRYQGSHRRR